MANEQVRKAAEAHVRKWADITRNPGESTLDYEVRFLLDFACSQPVAPGPMLVSTPRCARCKSANLGEIKQKDNGGYGQASYVDCQDCKAEFWLVEMDDAAQFFQPDAQPSPAQESK